METGDGVCLVREPLPIDPRLYYGGLPKQLLTAFEEYAQLYAFFQELLTCVRWRNHPDTIILTPAIIVGGTAIPATTRKVIPRIEIQIAALKAKLPAPAPALLPVPPLTPLQLEIRQLEEYQNFHIGLWEEMYTVIENLSSNAYVVSRMTHSADEARYENDWVNRMRSGHKWDPNKMEDTQKKENWIGSCPVPLPPPPPPSAIGVVSPPNPLSHMENMISARRKGLFEDALRNMILP